MARVPASALLGVNHPVFLGRRDLVTVSASFLAVGCSSVQFGGEHCVRKLHSTACLRIALKTRARFDSLYPLH